METKINVAEILKDKPQRTILYDYLHNIDVEFDNVEITEIETSIWCTRNKGGYNELFGYSKLGTLRGWLDGLQILLPSKEMRDWSKFSWKKGDVLVNKDESVHIIFEKFEDDAYKNFHGQYYLWEEGGSMVSFEEDENYMQTSDFNKANKEDAQEYIYKIEKILGGKLNMETLEIEKPQPEFKDGDIVFMKGIKGGYYANCIFILKSEYKDGDERAFYYAFYNTDDKFTIAEYGNTRVHYSLRPATDSEKQQLFDALAKKGKTWDAEKKMIVDLKPKIELKPFDKVLVRDGKNEIWEPAFFFRNLSHLNVYNYQTVGGESRVYCIPFNEETAKLIGTTKEWKG
nr:MAG TPA: hypothetical protein [Caudoviricetes sp.]